MYSSKIIIGSFIFTSLLFITLFQLNINRQRQAVIIDINEDTSNFDVNIEMDINTQEINFNSEENIDRILIFNSKGKLIRKEKPISNSISIKEFKNQELYISFIATNKVAFKSILY